MTARYARNPRSALLWAALALTTQIARAQAPAADLGAAKRSDPAPPALPAYHHSVFSWEHTLTTATLGVGDTPQSSDPTYTMGFVAKTRYYLLDDTPGGRHLSLRLDGGLYRELTNSDVTTQRGEWTLSDTDLAVVYARRFRGPADTDGTLAEIRPITLTLPTSKASFDSGRYFAPGVLVGLIQETPLLRGRVEPEILSMVRIAAGYKRWFARATVPTSESLERVRLTPEGRTLPGDTLSGATLVRDELELSARLLLAFGQDVLWTTDAALAPAWKYRVQDHVALCGVVATGCTDVALTPDDTRYLVRTQFTTEVSVRIARGFSIEVGYGNAENQLGRDGRRRSFFYSPEAVFFASASFFPHELATGSKQLAESRSTPRSL